MNVIGDLAWMVRLQPRIGLLPEAVLVLSAAWTFGAAVVKAVRGRF